MPLAQGRDLHIDAVLSNIMVGRKAVGGIADDLVPVANVGKQSNVYYKSNYKEQLLVTPNLTRRAKGGKSREVYWSVSSDTYFAKNYALATRWFDEDVVNQDDPIRLQRRSASFVTNRLKLDYETRIASLAGQAANVSTTFNISTPFSNVTGGRPFSDLVGQVEAFRQLTTLRPNVAIIPEQVMSYVRRSDEVRDILFGDRGGVGTNEQFRSLLNLDKLLVPENFQNTAGVGETLAGSGNAVSVWGNNIYLAYVADIQGQDQEDTWLQAFRWTDPAFGVPFAIRAFPHDDEARSQKIEASYYQDEKVVSPDLGMCINSAI